MVCCAAGTARIKTDIFLIVDTKCGGSTCVVQVRTHGDHGEAAAGAVSGCDCGMMHDSVA